MFPATPPNPNENNNQDVFLGQEIEEEIADDFVSDDDFDSIEVIVNEQGTHWGEEDPAEAGIDSDEFPAALAEVPGKDRVAQAFVSFMRRGVHAPDVALLSDLDRAGAQAFERAWPELDEATRNQVVRWMVDLREDRFDLHFARAFRVLLDDASPVVRQLAIVGLWEEDTADLRAQMITSLRHDPSPDVRAEAARFLSRLADEIAAGETDEPDGFVNLLFSIVENEAEPLVVRRQALETSGVLGASGTTIERESVRRLIAEAYAGFDGELRAAAIYAMGRTLDRHWLPAIIGELRSEDAELRYEAVRAAGELAEPSLVADLSDLVDDEDAEVRAAAIASLGKIGGPGAVRVLRTLAADQERNDLELIQDALDEALMLVDPLRLQS